MYVTGFCATGAHENTVVLSPSGVKLKPCEGTYFIPRMSTYGELLEVICTCQCHAAFRQMREIVRAKLEAERTEEFFDASMASLFEEPRRPPTPTPVAMATPVATSTHVPAVPMPRRPEENVTDLSDKFKPTASGRKARGQLEEQIRVVVAKYHELAKGMLTPDAIAKYINQEAPPSGGAIHACLSRWERRGWVTLDKKPFRLGVLTELGKRQIVR